jgi:membrane protease subunit HflC
MSAFGMDLVDVRIKRINYVEQVRKKVYKRMVSKKKRKAA